MPQSASLLVSIITAPDAAGRDRALDDFASRADVPTLLTECDALEAFRHRSGSLYERVRACFFLYAIHRFHLPTKPDMPVHGRIPFAAYENLLGRRFEEAVSQLLDAQAQHGPSDALSSALAAAYHRLAFQTLADQVRRSVKSVRGNQWMFRIGHPSDQPLRARAEICTPSPTGAFPVLREATPVRMDLTHSGWSDIFFLGMDYPEGARVLNVSIDLAVRGRDAQPKPPVEAYLRVLDEPVLRLASVDLGASAEITALGEVFDFARDYLGLLKAALIASGIIPPGVEGSEESLAAVLARVFGPGRGVEIISNVNGIPKGSRLAVSTNLLAALITVCMRATGQTQSVTGPLTEQERRTVAARAILGEWLAGSGGGWQDSGGVWPGIKLIEGQFASDGDPESGISRGRLLPGHTILGRDRASDATRASLQDSLVLVHGGMAQNVGPILEMVTEKYLLRSPAEWQARQETGALLEEILGDLQTGDIRGLADATTRNFFGPIQAIIPWASNYYTETLIREAKAEFGDDFWGFWMLGGMSGGGMGFIFDPKRKTEAQDKLQTIMSDTRRALQNALPFAMEPVVYDFAINENGTFATLHSPDEASLPLPYYAQSVPTLLRRDPSTLTAAARAELDVLGATCRTNPEFGGLIQQLFDRMLPRASMDRAMAGELATLLRDNGFDPVEHEQVREDLQHGRIGLAQNRLPISADIRDVLDGDVSDALHGLPDLLRARGAAAIENGEVAVVTLAAGVGSRWTQGAGVVKALHPFAKFAGRHRSFIETHLAKSRRVGKMHGGAPIPHVFTTSHLTHAPILSYLARENHYGYPTDRLILSPGRAVGLRLVPTERDLRFLWEEMPQQILDAQQQKMRDNGRAALIGWARNTGEASDYTDNLPSQCIHPVGHGYEVPNMLKNGVLADLLERLPNLRTLLVHNIDTLGADVDPALLGLHLESGAAMTVEVIPRRLEDRGGGLARVDGRLRLVEGLAMPREEDEFHLTYYNSLSTWVDIEQLLQFFGLERGELRDADKVNAAVRRVTHRLPTYVTLKDVKRRWGFGQEDVFPVAQWEKLWGDMTALPDWNCRFVAVPRLRGQQLKDQAQLDGWLRDGSQAHVAGLCAWE